MSRSYISAPPDATGVSRRVSDPLLVGAQFTGSISGSTLTVASVTRGVLSGGMVLGGSGVAAATTIVGALTGVAGGVGTYVVAPPQSVVLTDMRAAVPGYEFFPDTVAGAPASGAVEDTDWVPVVRGSFPKLYKAAPDQFSGPQGPPGAAATFDVGSVALVGGVATVSDDLVGDATRVFVTRELEGGTLGSYTVSRENGVGFTITSTEAGDTSTVSYLVVEG